MGNYWLLDQKKFNYLSSREILEKACEKLKEYSMGEDMVSINYLQNSDIRSEFQKQCQLLNIVHAKISIEKDKDIIYVLIYATSKLGQHYIFNFYPCLTCPCIYVTSPKFTTHE